MASCLMPAGQIAYMCSHAGKGKGGPEMGIGPDMAILAPMVHNTHICGHLDSPSCLPVRTSLDRTGLLTLLVADPVQGFEKKFGEGRGGDSGASEGGPIFWWHKGPAPAWNSNQNTYHLPAGVGNGSGVGGGKEEPEVLDRNDRP